MKLVCLPAEAELINAEGTLVRMPVKGRDGLGRARLAQAAGQALGRRSGGRRSGATIDLVALAMQEPQYRSPGVRELLDAVAKARVPCMSIMNMPPLPYLEAHSRARRRRAAAVLHRPDRVGQFRPGVMTLCSPDPQAFRPPEEKVNVLQVTPADQLQGGALRVRRSTPRMLRQLAADIEAARFDAGDGEIELPVKLKVHDSIFVPLAKWAMLLAGNYRCVTKDGGDRHQGRGARRPRRHRARSTTGCVGAVRSARRRGRTTWCRSRNTPQRAQCPGAAVVGGARAVRRRAQHRARRPAGADRSRRKRACASPVVDETVAIVDARLAANRKAAA